ncbi:MAG: sugar ABC transporter permease, partial [Desulfurococcaceae archaeon]
VLLAILYSSPMIYGRRIWRTMLLIPWAIPILLAGSSWKIMFLPGRGPLSIMTGLDYNNYEWHAFLIYNLFEAWLAYPFVMTVTMGALAGVSKDLIEASYIDGAGAWFRLRKVLFPQIAGPVIFASILTTGASLQAFMVPLLINGGGPTQTISIPWVGSRVGNVNEMMVLFGYNRAYRDKNYGYAAAAYIIVILILMAYIVLWLKFTKSRR